MAVPVLSPTYTIGAWAANVDDDAGTRWVIDAQDVLDGPGVKLRSTERPSGPGAYRLRSHPAAKSFTLSGWCEAPDEQAAETARQQLLGLFADGGQQQLVIDDGADPRFITVEQDDKIKVAKAGAFLDWQLPLYANDARFYSTTLQTASSAPQSTTSSGLDWNAGPAPSGLDWVTGGGLDWGSQQSSGVIAMFNDGSAETWPLFTLYGPLSLPRIVASGTGKVLAYGMDLAAGEVLTIDCSPFSRSVLLGGTTDRFASMTSAQWMSIPPGGSLFVTLAASGAGYLAASWRSASF